MLDEGETGFGLKLRLPSYSGVTPEEMRVIRGP